jgi:hypothetical protein
MGVVFEGSVSPWAILMAKLMAPVKGLLKGRKWEMRMGCRSANRLGCCWV